MGYTALERLLAPERLHQRAGKVGHSIPALQERPSTPENAPFVVTNMRGGFLSTRLSSTGVVRFGFSSVPLGQDDQLLLPLHQAISALSREQRCISIEQATQRLLLNGLTPRTIVLPVSWLPEICGADFDVTQAQQLMGTQGYVIKIDEVQVLVADLPPDKAFVATLPALVGVYTRIADYLGVLIFQADKTIVAVTRDVG